MANQEGSAGNIIAACSVILDSGWDAVMWLLATTLIASKTTSWPVAIILPLAGLLSDYNLENYFSFSATNFLISSRFSKIIFALVKPNENGNLSSSFLLSTSIGFPLNSDLSTTMVASPLRFCSFDSTRIGE